MSADMKAALYTKTSSGKVLEIREVVQPVPKDNEVLIRVRAASVNPLDWRLKRQRPGVDVAGEVIAVGRTVTQLRPGDAVFGAARGAFAEYACASQDKVVAKLEGMTFEHAAAVPIAGLTALQGLRDKGHLQKGQKVLINGAAGGIGTFAVQIARSFGAEVTAVCSTRNLDIMRSIGADYVIDYTQEDFTRNGQQYDLILAANGYHPIADYKRALRPSGTYVTTGGSDAQMFQTMLLGPWISRTGRQKMGNSAHKPNQKDLIFMKELIEAGKVTPIIDRRFPLRDVADAIRYLEAGHAQGKVVITVDQNDNTSL